jgi:hypothetical protein
MHRFTSGLVEPATVDPFSTAELHHAAPYAVIPAMRFSTAEGLVKRE